jgi:hypothetical protein
VKHTQPFRAEISFPGRNAKAGLLDLGQRGEFGTIAPRGKPSEEWYAIRAKDGGTEWIRLTDTPWWEEDEAKALAEYERKSRPIEVKTFEC